MTDVALALLSVFILLTVAGCNSSSGVSSESDIVNESNTDTEEELDSDNESDLLPEDLENSADADAASIFDDSEFVTERFGTATERNTDLEVEAAASATLVSAFNDFSLDLHRVASAENPLEGSVESGFSAAVAFSFASAATDAPTYSGLTNLLGTSVLEESTIHSVVNALSLALDSRANDGLVLRTANRLFVRPGLDLQTSFLDTATVEYGAPVTEANFAEAPEEVANEINGWVSDQTDGFIPTIVSSLPASTVFALLNAIFLDAEWRDTYNGFSSIAFTDINGNALRVEGFGGESVLPRLVRDDLTALEIPYAGNELAMLIMMPNDLATFEAGLNADQLDEIVNALEPVNVRFTAPNWDQSSDLDLLSLLSTVGIPPSPWNFDRLTNDEQMLDVIAKQRARIEVDEDGTRAAAVTAIAGVESITLSEQININEPFFYVLRDRTSGVVLFSGRVVAPQ